MSAGLGPLAYLVGDIVEKEMDHLVLDVNGVGYELVIDPSYANRMPAIGEHAQITCHLHVREDAHTLYAFPGRDEKALFLQLIAVSRIGPKMALPILGALPPDAFAMAVMRGDVKALTAAKGIGKKVAERLIVEMKDKVDKRRSVGVLPKPEAMPHAALDEAYEALLVLGYRHEEAMAALSSADHEASVETRLRVALSMLNRRRGVS